jgi:hypothetical protein
MKPDSIHGHESGNPQPDELGDYEAKRNFRKRVRYLSH